MRKKYNQFSLRSILSFIGVFCFLLAPEMTAAVPAPQRAISALQPDGSTLRILVHGDEFFHYTTTEDGYLIAQAPDGFYHYASYQSDGSYLLLPSRVSNPGSRSSAQLSGAGKSIPKRSPSARRMPKHSIASHYNAPSKTRSNGKIKSLVILVEFPDLPWTISHSYYDNLLNSDAKSAKQYFKDSSFGQFDPTFVVVGPVMLSKPARYYGENSANGNDAHPAEMCIEAVIAASRDGVNLAQFDSDQNGILDNIFIYFAGFNEAETGKEETIWPHSFHVQEGTTVDGVQLFNYTCASEYSGDELTHSPASIGTFCHEFGHSLGLPDVYDVDYAEHGDNLGLGFWSIMAIGSYLDDGKTPPQWNTLERMLTGCWQTIPLFTADGQYTLSPLGQQQEAYIFNTKNPGEYFIFENRAKEGWDAFIPGSGLLVYHVDRSENNRVGYTARSLWNMNMLNAYSLHQCMDLLEANGHESWSPTVAAGAPFPGSDGVTRLDHKGKPNSLAFDKSWTFTMSNITKSGKNVSFSIVNNLLHQNLPSLSIKGEVVAGESIVLKLSNVPFSTSERWLIDGVVTFGRTSILSAGEHEIRVELTDASNHTEVLIKYVIAK